VSDFQSFWRAFHPDFDWLSRWRKDGFVKKPANDRDAWKKLDEAMGDMEVTISADSPIEPDDKDLAAMRLYREDVQMLLDLTKLAQEAPNPRDIGKHDDPSPVGFSESNDALFRRAIERDDN
jgi:hypothetical protein